MYAYNCIYAYIDIHIYMYVYIYVYAYMASTTLAQLLSHVATPLAKGTPKQTHSIVKNTFYMKRTHSV